MVPRINKEKNQHFSYNLRPFRGPPEHVGEAGQGGGVRVGDALGGA